MIKKHLSGLIAVAFLVILCSGINGKFCTVNSIALNKISPYYDGQWQGIIAASDGACYFGSSSHTMLHGGGLFRFDPSKKQFDVLTDDLTKLVGDDITKNTPQGKCHCPIIEVDGTLYLTTHLAAYWKDVLHKYAGSYFLSYNMKEKKWTNYGIIKPRFSTYSAIEVDAKRGKAYAMVVPFAPQDTAEGNHLYQIDLKTKQKRDLGRLSNGKACFWFYLDDQGRVWSSVWHGTNALQCYDPETDKIITYQNAFPEPKIAPNGNPIEKVSFNELCWTWAKSIDGGKRCLFTMGDYGGGDERLWIFDPHKNISSKEAFTPICYIGNTFLSVALGGRRVYFIQRGDNKSSRGYSTEGNRDLPADENGYHVNDLHLKSVSLDQNSSHPFIDHGKLIDQDGRTPAYIGSLAADDKGNVFIDGGWLIKPGDQPTLKYIYEGNYYETLKRGEFFAWVNINKDLQ
jgi:hypothetical protein